MSTNKMRWLAGAAALTLLPAVVLAQSVTPGTERAMQTVQFTATGGNSWTVPASCNGGVTPCEFFVSGTAGGGRVLCDAGAVYFRRAGWAGTW